MRKSSKIIEGKDIYLRELQKKDVDSHYLGWMNDNDVTRYLESRFEIWSIKKLKDYIGEVEENPDYVFLAVVLRDGNKHIGNIKIGPINRFHMFADVGIIIGEKTFWGKGFAAETIKLVVDYAFNTLNLHKLTAGAYADNVGSIKAFKKAGFSVEGIRKKHYHYNGDYVDAVLLGILRK